VLGRALFTFSCSDEKKKNEDNGSQFPAVGAFDGKSWPTQDRKRCAPEEVGIDAEKRKLAYDFAANPK
jgi:hypothetical protein